MTDSLTRSLRTLLDGAGRRYARAAAALDPADGYPRAGRPDGSWGRVPAEDWTAGFFPGTLWLLYEATGDDRLRQQAARWTDPLEPQARVTSHHDVGFMIGCSFGNGCRLDPDRADRYCEVALQAAESLASRFSESVGAIRSWDFEAPDGRWRFPVIIDNLMNLELLFWAAENGGDAGLAEVAHRHALTSAERHLRPDGSTFHVADFDPDSGAFQRGVTWQGHADGSAWMRGQAWAVYGFAMAHRETGDPALLDAAERAADFYLAELPDDGVPLWDARAPGGPDEERDASAGSIAAAGLLDLAGLAADAGAAERYRQAADQTLQSLAGPAYAAPAAWAPILLRSVGSKPEGTEVAVPLTYADYYAVEAALRRLRGVERPDPHAAGAPRSLSVATPDLS